jgi:hypothetical protein
MLLICNRFLDLIIIAIMKHFFNNRQKFTLNRVKKPSTPTKVSMEVINGLKLGVLPNPLKNQDTNALRSGNSSIFKK